MSTLSAQIVERRNTESPRVSVVIPAMNEALNLAVVLPKLPPVHEVILVDGGSVDGTVDAARRARPGVITVAQVRRGRGNALATGFAHVSGDIVVTFDADGSSDPAEIGRFVAALQAGADFAKGSRFVEGGSATGIPVVRKLGNWLLRAVFMLLFHTAHRDPCYGFNAFWTDLIPLLDLPDHTAPSPRSGDLLWGDGFEIETVINCRFAAAGLRTTEVPSTEQTRLFGRSSVRVLSDGVRALRTMRTEARRTRGVRRLERQLAVARKPDRRAAA